LDLWGSSGVVTRSTQTQASATHTTPDSKKLERPTDHARKLLHELAQQARARGVERERRRARAPLLVPDADPAQPVGVDRHAPEARLLLHDRVTDLHDGVMMLVRLLARLVRLFFRSAVGQEIDRVDLLHVERALERLVREGAAALL